MCKELPISSGYEQCLASLAKLACQDSFTEPPWADAELADFDDNAFEQLRDNQVFLKWLQGTSGSLQVTGTIGNIVHKLVKQTDKYDNDIVIQFRYDASHQKHLEARHIYASFCYQILRLRPQLFSCVADIYTLYLENTKWPLNCLQSLLLSLVHSTDGGRTVCLIHDMHQASVLERIIPSFVTLANDTAHKLKLLVTTELEPGPKVIWHCPKVRISRKSTTTAQLKNLISAQVEALVTSRSGLSLAGHHLISMMEAKFESDSQLLELSPTFISHILHTWLTRLVRLSNPVSILSLEWSATVVPNRPDALCRQILWEIPEKNRHQARNVVSWLVRACRPLSLDELAIASVLGEHVQGGTSLEKIVPLDIAEDMSCYLGSLIQIDSNGVVHLTKPLEQYSQQEQSHRKSWPDWLAVDSHGTVARNCLKYILSLHKEMKKPKLLDPTQVGSRFLSYAAQYWPEHYKETRVVDGTANDADFDEFFHNADLMHSWAQLYFDLKLSGTGCESSVEPLSVAVEIGCPKLVSALLRRQAPDSPALTTALNTAMKTGSKPIIELFRPFLAKNSEALHLITYSGHKHLLSEVKKTAFKLSNENLHGLTPLHCACQAGNIAMVRELLHLGSDPKLKSSITNQNSLHVACQYGHTKLINFLLYRGVNIEACDNEGLTPLHLACKWQQPMAVATLLSSKQGAKLGKPRSDSTSPLHLAAESGRADIINRLLQHRIEHSVDGSQGNTIRSLLEQQDGNGSTPLHCAIAGSQIMAVGRLLQYGQPHNSSHLDVKDHKGRLPIHLAAENGCFAAVELLLSFENCAKMISAGDKNNACPAHLAVRGGHFAVLELLCAAHRKHKVSLNLFDESSTSILHAAVEAEQADMVNLLLDNEATAFISNRKDDTPLIIACATGKLRIAEILVKKTNAIEVKAHTHRPPLLVAAGAGYLDIVKFLIENGANIHMQDRKDRSPFLAACRGGNLEIVKLLQGLGADTKATDSKGRQAVHFAVESGRLDTLKFILDETGANADAVNSKKQTPLHLALLANHFGIVDELVRRKASAIAEDIDGNSPLGLAKEEHLALKLLSSINFDDIGNTDDVVRKILFRAACRGHVGIIKIIGALEKFDAQFESSSSEGKSMFHFAAAHGHAAVIKYLQEMNIAGIDSVELQMERNPLSYAAASGHLAVVQLLLKDPKASREINKADTDGRTPLWHAIKGGCTEVAKELLMSAADTKRADSTNVTPLHLAAQKGLLELLGPLVEGGAEIDARDSSGKTAVFLAANHGHKSFVTRLIELGADLTIADDEGRIALHVAYRSIDILEAILENGVDVNTARKDGATVLHMASGYSEASTKFLLEKHADRFKLECNGISPVHITARLCKVATCKALLTFPPDSPRDGSNEDGGSPPLTASEAFANADERLLKSIIDTAMVGGSAEIVSAALECFGPRLALKTLGKLHAWADAPGRREAAETALRLIRRRDPESIRSSAVLSGVALKKQDVKLAEFLLEHNYDAGFRDDDGRSLEEMVAAQRKLDEAKQGPV